MCSIHYKLRFGFFFLWTSSKMWNIRTKNQRNAQQINEQTKYWLAVALYGYSANPKIQMVYVNSEREK